MERRRVQSLDRSKGFRATQPRGGQNGLQENFQLESSLNSWLRIGLVAQNKQLVFTNLFDHFKVENLREAFHAIDGSKAIGTDNISKSEYACDLDKNLKDLEQRLQAGTYRPQPKKEVLIPKSNGKTRPIAISCFEDKIVEWVLGKLLSLSFEPLFISNSFGFRPRRSPHDAIKAAFHILKDDQRPFVVEIDMENFFNTVSHKKLMKVVQGRIKDRRMSGLIARFLKTKISRKDSLSTSTIGTPQGSIMSPILANIYLNHVMDQWFIKNHASKTAQMVRYADDVIFMFSKHEDAMRFKEELEKRLNEYQLILNVEKTKVTDFRKESDQIFSFLGFTFYWGKKLAKKRSSLKLKTEKKQFFKKVDEFKQWLKSSRNTLTSKELLQIIASKLRGHYNYYGVMTNQQWLGYFYNQVLHLIYKWFNRRSQRKSLNWDKVKRLQEKHLPKPPTMKKLIPLEKTYVW